MRPRHLVLAMFASILVLCIGIGVDMWASTVLTSTHFLATHQPDKNMSAHNWDEFASILALVGIFGFVLSGLAILYSFMDDV